MKIGDIIKAGLVKGDDTATIIKAVKAIHPDAQTTPASVAWYRSKMRKTAAPAKKPAKAKATVPPVAMKTAPTKVAEALQVAYHVGSIKATTGMEGSGFITSLYRGAAKVADVMDYGDGASVRFEWLDDQTIVDIEAHNDFKNEDKVTGIFKGTLEQKRFLDFCRALPKEVNPYDETKTPRYVSGDCFVENLVNDAYLTKQFRSLIKGRIAYIDSKGKLYTYKASPTPENILFVKGPKAGGKDAVVLNELTEEEGVKLLRSMQRG